MKRAKSMFEVPQVEFGFAAEVTAIGRRLVERLNRFEPSIILENTSAFAWAGWCQITTPIARENMRKAAARGLREISYTDWLRFYSPLSSPGKVGAL